MPSRYSAGTLAADLETSLVTGDMATARPSDHRCAEALASPSGSSHKEARHDVRGVKVSTFERMKDLKDLGDAFSQLAGAAVAASPFRADPSVIRSTSAVANNGVEDRRLVGGGRSAICALARPCENRNKSAYSCPWLLTSSTTQTRSGVA
jgi:hypothetical protein